MSEDIIELPTTKTRTPWKTITLGALLVFSCGGYCTMSMYSWGLNAFKNIREEYVNQRVNDYLIEHPVKVEDLKTKKNLDVTKKEDLLKMVYITHVRMSQCESKIDRIESAMMYEAINFTQEQEQEEQK
jgi:hypothetical protein